MTEQVLTLEELKEKAIRKFRQEFNGMEPEVAVCAPGRVNLIGDHTDYNDGYVLPMALPLVTLIVGKRIPGAESTLVTDNESVDEPKKVTILMPNSGPASSQTIADKPKWANYVKGVVANYIGETPAFLASIVSSVPTGGGLSSSAALEVACYTFLDALQRDGPNRSIKSADKALACQKAEHDYAGMPCGIMDQTISLLGKKNNALLIDCRSLSSELVPLDDVEIVVLITDSSVKHELTGSEYSSRRKQCQQAALLLHKASLRDASLQDVQYLKGAHVREEVYKRAKHVVSEIERTYVAAKALRERDYKKFGELMNESHKSLRDDFEVSCPEVDQLVEIASACAGVLGSRMTGGGFGGCTVTMVYEKNVEDVMNAIKSKFTGKPKFYICKPSDGSRLLSL